MEYILEKDECGLRPKQIWSLLRRSDEVAGAVWGIPTHEQVSNCVKYLRKLRGSKNAIFAIKALARSRSYHVDIASDAGFIFGSRRDADGYPQVGKGVDDDPFVLGVSSVDLMQKSAAFATEDRFTLFHMNATFKLSDLGYPVITCGFTDKTRRYQLAAIFVVSRRTIADYKTVLASLCEMIKRVTGKSIHVDAVMGDAEDAQYTAIQSIPEFRQSTFLMCFFHVLYNVRKRTHQLLPIERFVVMKAIMVMHFSENEEALQVSKTVALGAWGRYPKLAGFTKYFTEQWLSGRYEKWQIFHTPPGYAVTNNLCEPFNASLKLYTKRESLYVQKLLQTCLKVSEDLAEGALDPLPMRATAPVNSTIKKAAKMMLQTGVVKIETVGSSCCIPTGFSTLTSQNKSRSWTHLTRVTLQLSNVRMPTWTPVKIQLTRPPFRGRNEIRPTSCTLVL